MSYSKSIDFASDVLKIVSGTTLAQIIIILSSPIITRLYGPEAFGLLGIFTSITAIIGIIACMSLNYAIILPKTNEEAINLLALCLLMVSLVSFITVPIVLFYGEFIAGLLNASELKQYLILIPPFVFVSGIFLALNAWNSRINHFGRLSVSIIIQSLSSTIIRIGAGFSGYATGGSLIGASIVGSTISTVILGVQTWKDDHSLLRRGISWEGMLEGLKRYKKFPLIDSGSRLLNAISWQLPVFLLAGFFSPEIAGFYILGFMVFQFPMSLIGDSIAKVFLQRASEARFDNTLPFLVENVFRMLIILGIYPIIAVTIIGTDLFTVVFGEMWTEAGLYAQILGIWAFVWFVASPISTLWAVLEKQEFGLQITSLNLITRFSSLAIGALFGSPVIALLLFAFSGVFVYGYLIKKMLFFSGVKLMPATRTHLSSSLIIVFPSGVILIGMKITGIESIFIVIISLLFGILYYLYIGLTDPQVKSLISFIVHTSQIERKR